MHNLPVAVNGLEAYTLCTVNDVFNVSVVRRLVLQALKSRSKAEIAS